MNYEAERAMNQKRLRMEGEPGHGVVQGNGLPLNYIDNGHQIPYQPYAGAYNTHYPPPDAFAAYGPPPGGAYAQNLSYAPPAHQNYPHHQPFPQQQQLHMPQTHMALFPVQGYGEVVHKGGWPPQPHLLPLDAQKPLDVKQLKPEIKLEPTDAHKRPHPESEIMKATQSLTAIEYETRATPRPDELVQYKMGGDLDQPKIKIKTDIFKPDDLAHRPGIIDKPLDVAQKVIDVSQKPVELQNKDGQAIIGVEKPGDKPAEASKPEGASEGGEALAAQRAAELNAKPPEKSDEERKPFSSPDLPTSGSMPGKSPGLEPKKRGRPKGSTNKPKAGGGAATRLPAPPPAPRAPPRAPPAPAPRPRGAGYQYAVRPFRKDFSGIQFRRRWSDECLESSHIPNEVYFGDVPVSLEVLHNYYDAHAERERLAAAAAHIAAQKAAAARLQAARLQAAGGGRPHQEVTTVDSSSSDDSSGSSASDSEDSDEDTPLKRGPGRPKGTKNSPRSSVSASSGGGTGGSAGGGTGGGTGGKRGRPPVPPELRAPGITEMKKFCKAAGIRFDYKKLTEGCTKNKERVQKMMDLLTEAGLEGKPTLEKCQAIKKAKLDKKEQDKQAKKEAKTKHKEEKSEAAEAEPSARRMTRGATGVKPRQRIVISSDEEDATPAARRALSKLRSSVHDTDSDD